MAPPTRPVTRTVRPSIPDPASRPQFAKRTSSVGQLTPGGLGKQIPSPPQPAPPFPRFATLGNRCHGTHYAHKISRCREPAASRSRPPRRHLAGLISRTKEEDHVLVAKSYGLQAARALFPAAAPKNCRKSRPVAGVRRVPSTLDTRHSIRLPPQ